MKKNKKKGISLKEYLGISLWSLKIAWGISPFASTALLITETLRGIRPLINTYVLAKLIDILISLASSNTHEIRDIIPFLIILLLISIFFSLNDEIRGYSMRILRVLAKSYLEEISYKKMHNLGVQTLELPDISNSQQKAKEWLGLVTDVSNNVVRIISQIIKSIAAAFLLMRTVPIVIPLVIITAIVFYFQRGYFFKKEFDWQTNEKNLTNRRRSFWLSSNLSDPRQLGEISITGVFDFFNKKYTSFFNYYNEGLKNIVKKGALGSFLSSVLSNIALIIGNIQVIKLLLNKVISIGDTTFYMNTIGTFYDGVASSFSEIIAFRDFVMKVREPYIFFNLKPVVKDGETFIPRFVNPPLIEIKNISFHYPNSKTDVLKNFSLTIQPGEKLAIVGENGAGKTTLVKLLSRIYDPQEGEILINGIDLKDIKINDWYKNLGVLFQDYNLYGELTVEENIYAGKSIKPLDREKIIEAAKNAEAHDFVMKYKKKYNTVLSERFKGGIRPSTGQSQKIAIARFFYRNAPVAIFDEPTSAIDAEAEYKIFNRIYNFFINKSVLIISHRFSTVRNADRIIVIHDGNIVEEGTHKELVSLGGLYSSAYKKQAEGYQE